MCVLAGISICFFTLCAIIYFAAGGWVVGLALMIHGIIIACSFGIVWYAPPVSLFCTLGTAELLPLRMLSRPGPTLPLLTETFVRGRLTNKTMSLSLASSMELLNFTQIFMGAILSITLHVQLGGFRSGASSDWFTWTVLSPVAALFFVDAKPQRTNKSEHDTEYRNGFGISGLIRQKRVRQVLWLRYIIFACLISMDAAVTRGYHADDPHMGSRLPDELSYTAAEWLKVLFFIVNHIVCPVFIVVACRVTVLEFLHRRALILQMKVEVDQAEDMNKNLLHSLVPSFLVAELVKTPPVEWHKGAKDIFRDCSIIQMDLVGFTQLSGQIEIAELVSLLNSLFTKIDNCAARIGNVWKVDTIGDCYIGVVGGPDPCEDHASRAVLLACCIIEVVRERES